MLRLEPRAAPSDLMAVASPLIAVALTALLAALLFMALGKDPVRGLAVFFFEPLNGARAVSEVLLKATPLITIALGLALCFRANVWNIGAEGQFLLGALAGGGMALALTAHGVVLPKLLSVPLVLTAGALGGAAWAAITALLRDRFNANEILVSLMLVYIAQQLVNLLVFGAWKDPLGFNFPQTRTFDASTWLPLLVPPYRVHIGLPLALLLALAAWLLMFRSLRGFEMQVGGLAPAAARYAGFSPRRSLWTALLLSGALAGLAGAMEAAGPLRQLTPHISTGLGFTAIIVCFVGRLHPLGMVLASVLLSMMLIGGELAQSRLGLPNALTGVFQGLLLVLLLACDTLIHFRLRRRARGTGAPLGPARARQDNGHSASLAPEATAGAASGRTP
jgi:general nucleoside transport system permease protein